MQFQLKYHAKNPLTTIRESWVSFPRFIEIETKKTEKKKRLNKEAEKSRNETILTYQRQKLPCIFYVMAP